MSEPFQTYARPVPATQPAPANGLGTVSFIIALIGFSLGLLGTLAVPLFIRFLSFNYPDIGPYTTLSNLFVLMLAVTALVLGLVAVRRPRSKVLPGIAIGISAAQIIGILTSWFSTALYTLSYSLNF